MNYIGTLKHTKIYATKLEIPRRYYLILYKYFIVRKIVISCEVVFCFYIHLPFSIHSNRIHCSLFVSK